jgi:DNA-binding GntR family transcriptional regulator
MYETKPNQCSVEEHEAILQAIEQGDEQKAIQLMEAHLGEYARSFR